MCLYYAFALELLETEHSIHFEAILGGFLKLLPSELSFVSLGAEKQRAYSKIVWKSLRECGGIIPWLRRKIVKP